MGPNLQVINALEEKVNIPAGFNVDEYFNQGFE